MVAFATFETSRRGAPARSTARRHLRMTDRRKSPHNLIRRQGVRAFSRRMWAKSFTHLGGRPIVWGFPPPSVEWPQDQRPRGCALTGPRRCARPS